MSKKYKEELDKIVMNEDMKKRILQNVLNKDIEAKSTVPRAKKYNSLKRNMQLAAACFTVVVCLSVVKSYPEIFKHKNSNFEQNQVIKDSDDENKVLKSSEENESNDNNKDSTNNNDGVEKHESINSDINNDENYKKSNSVKNENNDNLYNNKNSSEMGQKEKSSNNSEANSSVSSNASSETQANTNAEKANPIDSDNNSKDVTKNQDETTSKKKKENNDLDNSPMVEACGYSIKEYKTLEEAEDVVKLKINPIKILPKAFNMANISVITNQIIQIEYSNGQDDITFRAGKDIDNISGDYNIYKIKNTCKVNGINTTLEGNKNKIFNLATWEKDGISYSISSTNGIDEDVILNMIKSNL